MMNSTRRFNDIHRRLFKDDSSDVPSKRDKSSSLEKLKSRRIRLANLFGEIPESIQEPETTINPLQRLIESLEERVSSNHSTVSSIKYPHLLIRALKELDQITGMDRLKESSASQVMRLINAINSGETRMGMLNTILYGKPGVGKTSVGLILAKIWYSLGFLEKNNKLSLQRINSYLGLDADSANSMASFLLFASYIAFTYFAKLYRNKGLKYTLLVMIVAIIFFVIIGCLGFFIYWKYLTPSGLEEINDNISEEINEKQSREIIKVVSRSDFVAQYMGQSAPKTKGLLLANLGKVLFIDEAYSLYNGPHDQYGMEVLTTLNLFLSENPNKIVVIFAGYKELMQNGIFSVQPGLARRCMWHLECDEYNGDQLGQIFLSQLRNEGLRLDQPTQALNLIKENASLFPSFGGDTQRLLYFSRLATDSRNFYNSSADPKIIKLADVEYGLQSLRKNTLDTSPSIGPEELEKYLDPTLLSSRRSSRLLPRRNSQS